jgi:hypothetical protein
MPVIEVGFSVVMVVVESEVVVKVLFSGGSQVQDAGLRVDKAALLEELRLTIVEVWLYLML